MIKFKTERHQLNYNLHRLAIKIAGKKNYRHLLDNLIVEQLSKRSEVPIVYGNLSSTLLTDDEAKNVLKVLKRLLRPGYHHSKQDKIILRVAKYKLRWSNEGIFNYIIHTCPEIRKRLTDYEIRHPKLDTLFRILNSDQKDLIIKRILMIEKKFQKNETK